MSNSIWKTGDLREASTKKLILYFAGGDWNFLYAEGKSTLARMKQAHEQCGK